jgi:hypothetical protein
METGSAIFSSRFGENLPFSLLSAALDELLCHLSGHKTKERKRVARPSRRRIRVELRLEQLEAVIHANF